MKTTVKGLVPGAKIFRKEIMFSAAELQLLRYAAKCYGLDKTTTIRLLIRSGLVELVKKHIADGVPKLSLSDRQILEDGGMI